MRALLYRHTNREIKATDHVDIIKHQAGVNRGLTICLICRCFLLLLLLMLLFVCFVLVFFWGGEGGEGGGGLHVLYTVALEKKNRSPWMCQHTYAPSRTRTHLSVCLSICPSVLSVCLCQDTYAQNGARTHLFACISVRPIVCLSARFVGPYVYLSVCMSTNISCLYVFLCLSVCVCLPVSVCLSVCVCLPVSVCLSVCAPLPSPFSLFLSPPSLAFPRNF